MSKDNFNICSIQVKDAVKIVAVGDIAFVGELEHRANARVFSQTKNILTNANLTLANLESPLLEDGTGLPGKCLLKGSISWAPILTQNGIDVVSLANNHIMDYGAKGLVSTCKALKNANIKYIGAGLNSKDALSPIVLSVGNKRIGILARSSVEVKAPIYATENGPGAARFELSETISKITDLRDSVDCLVLLLHWGIENHLYPSPSQRNIAKVLIDSGLDIIIGHHPHVTQGVEYYRHGFIAYSLGNFIFCDFDWHFKDLYGQLLPQHYALSKENKNGAMLQLNWSKNQISHRTNMVVIEQEGMPQLTPQPRNILPIDRLSRRLRLPFYSQFWRGYALRQEWCLRLRHELSLTRLFRNIHKLRWHHLAQAYKALKRSSRMAAGKTTNPYD